MPVTRPNSVLLDAFRASLALNIALNKRKPNRFYITENCLIVHKFFEICQVLY